MTVPDRLSAVPVRADGAALPRGLTAGRVTTDPLIRGARSGRARRWAYAAAAQGELAVGAAVVDLGIVGTAFAWAALDGRLLTWERRALLGRGLSVGAVPGDGAWSRTGAGRLELDGDGGLRIDLPVDGGTRLRAELTAGPTTSVTLATGTAGGGWNMTEKAAGYAVEGWVAADGARRAVTGGGWRDWTAGRQDRHTTWRWAAGAGRDHAGRPVGLNVSTGMNAAGEGEDVVWWDGVPYRLEVEQLAPIGDDPEGPWTVAGPGWRLELDPWGARAADESLWLLRSRYVQPVGRFRGSLPGPDGQPVEVEDLVGVTEDHAATW